MTSDKWHEWHGEMMYTIKRVANGFAVLDSQGKIFNVYDSVEIAQEICDGLNRLQTGASNAKINS